MTTVLADLAIDMIRFRHCLVIYSYHIEELCYLVSSLANGKQYSESDFSIIPSPSNFFNFH